MDISLIGAQLCVGSPFDGTEQAPAAIAGKLGLNVDGHPLPLRSVSCANTRDVRHGESMRNLDSVMSCCSALYAAVSEAFADGCAPLVLGGDHSMSIGTIAASACRFGAEETGVIWIDAHTDVNTPATTRTGYLHGMPLAAACGLCPPAINPVTSPMRINPENCFILGARSIDEAEYVNIEEYGYHLCTFDEVMKNGLPAALARMRREIRAPRVHVSFDVDCLAPEVFSATGTLSEGGFDVRQAREILDFVFDAFRVTAAEFVEYNPMLDTGNDLLTVCGLAGQAARLLGGQR